MMERKGGCCLAPRYGAAAGAGGQASMAWQMGKIMLKFRPIAPKPAAMAPAPTPAPVAAVVAGRGKRKSVGGGGGRRGRKPKKAATVAAVTPVMATATEAGPQASDEKDREKQKSLSSPSSSSGMTSVDSSPPPPPLATLPLMPVSPVENNEEKVTAATEEPPVAPAHVEGQVVVAPRALRPAASWVTVEDVTGTWRDGEASSTAVCSGGDEVPTFVSDQWGRVTWANAAFNRAVSGGGDDAAASEVRVGLAAKGGTATVPAWGTCAGFTCRVRVRYACPRRGSLVAPCDVWRLDAGSYLWRLDLQAALSLGALP